MMPSPLPDAKWSNLIELLEMRLLLGFASLLRFGIFGKFINAVNMAWREVGNKGLGKHALLL